MYDSGYIWRQKDKCTMIKLNKCLKAYLIKLIKPTKDEIKLQYSELAIRIIERGYITEFELQMLKNIGFKEM